jgi:hypothetical protein
MVYEDGVEVPGQMVCTRLFDTIYLDCNLQIVLALLICAQLLIVQTQGVMLIAFHLGTRHSVLLFRYQTTPIKCLVFLAVLIFRSYVMMKCIL